MSIISIKVKSILKCTMLGTYLRKRMWNKGLINLNSISKTIDKYMGEIPYEEKSKIQQDILNMAKRYRFSAEEYVCYHFKDKDESERKTFISDLNRVDFCESLNKAKNLAIFDDKMYTYKVFGKYYGRDLCYVKNEKDFIKFQDFLKKHKRVILKPVLGTCGQGIQIADISKITDLKKYFEELKQKYCYGMKDGFIAEELIIQIPEMAQFHPSSLNTIRVATVKFDEGVEVIAAYFRTGRGGNIVDNAGAGGVFGTIDIATGKIDAVGDEYGNTYETHPDTDLKMIGFEIPHWQEAKEMAQELASIVKGNRYAGWDLALTEKGWVMIEGNARGQFVWQMPRQKGFLKEVNDILKRLGLPQMKKLSI
ncbi:MAG: hypothetical protein IJW78_01820 [Clostridia bacterium]|nr:hypothetical protein [Clostridia bacterium]